MSLAELRVFEWRGTGRTEQIITRWKSEGFEFVTIPELIVATGFDSSAGEGRALTGRP